MSDSKFMKKVQKSGAFENEPNDRHYTLCPECGCGTDDVTASKFGMCVDCHNEGDSHLHCGDEKCDHNTGMILFDGTEERTGTEVQIILCTYGCNKHIFVVDGKIHKSIDCAFLGEVLVDDEEPNTSTPPMTVYLQERANELGCTVALVEYIDELETRVRFLEDLPTLKAEGLAE